MLPEIALLKYLLNYDNYVKYFKYIEINKNNYKELYIIYNVLPKFFKQYPRDASVDEFSAYFYGYYPRLKAEELAAYQAIFAQAATSTVSNDVASDLFQQAHDRAVALDIAQKSIAFSEGKVDRHTYVQAFDDFDVQGDSIGSPDTFVTDDLAELKHETYTKSGLRWRLPTLNRSLGSLRLGDFGFVFARPETGKTTFLASEVTFMAKQAERPIIWFNNEEQGRKVKLRCFQATLGVTLDSLFSRVSENQARYMEETGGRILLHDSASMFRAEVEGVIQRVEPALIIFDQIDKIRGFDADRQDLVMGSIYQWARGLAKTYAPVIGVCQADNSGENVKWLSMSNVAEAKTAKQSEADWILGIGRLYADEFANIRHFYLSKNKLIGDSDTDPEWRHAKWDVRMHAHLARYEDL